MTINEYSEHVNSVVATCGPYPRGGSTGVYMAALTEKMNIVSPTAFKLFMYIASDINEYGQTIRTRTNFNKVLGLKPNKARMSGLMKELIEAKMVVLFDKAITVNPNLVLPTVRNPKIKAAIQDAWLDLIEFT